MKANNFNYLPCLITKIDDKFVRFYIVEEDDKFLVTMSAPVAGKKTKPIASFYMRPDCIVLTANETFVKGTPITVGDALVCAVRSSLSILAPMLGKQIKSDGLIVLVLALSGEKVGEPQNNVAKISYPTEIPGVLKQYLSEKQLENPILNYLNTPAE